jgi:hypothetical protein
MRAPKKSAKDAARFRCATDIWIDHATIVDDDESWLSSVRTLTLWNVQFPTGFLARLRALRRLDVRGGSATRLSYLSDCPDLEMLVVNQVRGLGELNEVSRLLNLRLLSLYGLPKLETAPSLSQLRKLHRLDLGSLKGLKSIAPFLEAPNLRELLLLRKMGLGSVDASVVNAHPTLRAFDWFDEDVPMRISQPVKQAIRLPKARSMHPEDWFATQED